MNALKVTRLSIMVMNAPPNYEGIPDTMGGVRCTAPCFCLLAGNHKVSGRTVSLWRSRCEECCHSQLKLARSSFPGYSLPGL